MAVQQLSTLVASGGLRSPNFFNGRLLSGEDLTSEHAANDQARDRLGRTIGDGIAYGLQVANGAGSTPGRTNRHGQARTRPQSGRAYARPE